MLGHYTNSPLVGADGVAPPEYLNNSFTDCPATIYGISSQIGREAGTRTQMLRLSVVDTNRYMTSLYGGELGTRTLTLIARASKTRMATNYINSPLIFVLVPPVIFEMTTFRSSGGCSYRVSYRGIIWYPQNDLNVHCWFRRPGVYPLAYKGIFGAQSRTRTGTPRRTRHFKCRMSTVPSLGHLAEMVGFRPTK